VNLQFNIDISHTEGFDVDGFNIERTAGKWNHASGPCSFP